MKAKRCSVDGCDRKYKCKGYCSVHYNRVRRNGKTERELDIAPMERFWHRVNKTPTCWLWTGSVHPSGHGLCSVDGVRSYAHRVSWEAVNGTIPEGMEIDHTCHVPACVNPAHLRVVTHKQNQENRRGASTRSKSGVRGVYWREDRKKWAGSVLHNYKTHHVGHFDSIEEAAEAVSAKRNELFTHNDLDRRAVMAGERHLEASE